MHVLACMLVCAPVHMQACGVIFMIALNQYRSFGETCFIGASTGA